MYRNCLIFINEFKLMDILNIEQKYFIWLDRIFYFNNVLQYVLLYICKFSLGRARLYEIEFF